MSTHRLCLIFGLVLVLVSGGAGLPAQANDTDGDGIDDVLDVCNNTPPNTRVDAQGRPLGDLDLDCDTDLDDFARLQQGLTGPLLVSPMVLIPAGEFQMGDSFDEGQTGETPVHAVHLDAYWIGKFEVTNQQYADALNWAFAQGGMIAVSSYVVYQLGADATPIYCYTHIADDDSCIHWDGATFTVSSGKENHPMVEVTWYGAVAYCNWRSAMEGQPLCYDLGDWSCDFGVAGYRLPTEAEWEKAGAWNPLLQRHYRFGEQTDGCGFNCLDGQRANYYLSGDPFDPANWIPETTPVGFYNGSLHHREDVGWAPPQPLTYQTQQALSYYGCYDMTGNVSEWCYDRSDTTYYAVSPYENPTGSASGDTRIARGGHWHSSPQYCRSAYRGWSLPGSPSQNIGFRCAMNYE